MTAQRRSPIKKVPARNGRLRRDRPIPWAPCRIVVIATVASKPQIIMLQNDGRPVTDIGSPVRPSRRQRERARGRGYPLTDEARLTAEARWRAAPSIPPLPHKKAASRL